MSSNSTGWDCYMILLEHSRFGGWSEIFLSCCFLCCFVHSSLTYLVIPVLTHCNNYLKLLGDIVILEGDHHFFQQLQCLGICQCWTIQIYVTGGNCKLRVVLWELEVLLVNQIDVSFRSGHAVSVHNRWLEEIYISWEVSKPDCPINFGVWKRQSTGNAPCLMEGVQHLSLFVGKAAWLLSTDQSEVSDQTSPLSCNQPWTVQGVRQVVAFFLPIWWSSWGHSCSQSESIG